MYTRLHAANGIVGEGVKFERIRRVTGYLVGTLDRALTTQNELRFVTELSICMRKKNNMRE